MYFSIALCTAIIISGFQTVLFPSLLCHIMFFAGFLLLLLALPFSGWRYLLIALSGLSMGTAYANLFAAHRIESQLPHYLESQDIHVNVRIASLPVNKGRYQQYMATVQPDSSQNRNAGLGLILLNDYEPKAIRPCDTWQMTVRLKRPHGLGNPGGFDYEAYLLELGVEAKGYVRKAQLLSRHEGYCLHAIRQSWSNYVLERLPVESAAWIIALSTGDKTLLNEEQNLLLRETGTTHLFVISGSHIALCALAVYWVLMLLRRMGLGRLWSGDWRPFVAFMSLLVAAAYTALAGFGVPSVRSLIMLTVFLGAQVLGLQTSLWLRYWLSMVLVLLINPLSALNVGFVLSFGAVFVLILLAETAPAHHDKPSRFLRYKEIVKLMLWSQLVVFIGLLPFTLLYFSQVSLLAPLVNFIAIPSMSIAILPTILLALLTWCISNNDFGLLNFAAWQLELLFRFIEIANLFFKEWLTTFPTLAFSHDMIGVLLVGCLFLLLPPALMMRKPGLLLLMAVFVSDARQPLPEKTLVIDVIDVDQGLSILVQTAHHQLLFDTGAAWPDGSMMDRAIKPYLLKKGITRLDTVFISHLDNDHAGGIYALLNDFAVGTVFSSESIPLVESHLCKAGQRWQWDGVEFTVLHPADADHYWTRNDKSCVLLIEVAGKRILLPGDIGSGIEQELLAGELPHIDVMVAPHHGSKTSSTPEWVRKVENGLVVYSSGYLSQFGHPHKLVQQRYRSANVQEWNTSLDGLVSISVDAGGVLKTHGWREQEGKYWHKTVRKSDFRAD